MSWVLGEQPIVLGRGIGCDITVSDPLASRRHCEIDSLEGEIRLRDLGSSNATLVNGHPVTEVILSPGDEVAVGKAVFIVVRDTGREAATPIQERFDDSTITIATDESLFVQDDLDVLLRDGRPQTVLDLAFLYNMGRALSLAENSAALVGTLAERLAKRFAPQAMWIARLKERDGDLTFYELPALEDLRDGKAPADAIWRCVREQRAQLVPSAFKEKGQRVVKTTMVAPVAVGGSCPAVIALQTCTPQGIYDEGDLGFLLAVAHQAAPFFHSVETVERLRRENVRYQRLGVAQPRLIGNSKATKQVRALIEQAAQSNLAALLQGETGTGKEMVAHLIHEESSRAAGPFVIVNCAAIPRELFESEFFGYVKGAFTGANARKIGFFEKADRGTLFLDEVGDLSPDNQGRILRAIELGSFYPVGATTESKVNVRVVAATNRPVDPASGKGTLREDLYHRLNGIAISLPPLRERRADIEPLVRHFLGVHSELTGAPPIEIDAHALQMLERHSWPGNIRELRTCLERAVVMAQGGPIGSDTLHLASGASNCSDEDLLTLEEMERIHIGMALKRCGGNVSATARALGVSRNTLYNKLAYYNVAIQDE